MAANNRIFYACQMVGLAKSGHVATHSTVIDVDGNPGTDKMYVAHGVQSVGITTNFNLEQAFELGQIHIYENIEGLPDVEVTMEKVLDGYELLYHLAAPAPESVGLVGRSKERCDLSLGIYSDAFDSVTDSGQSAVATGDAAYGKPPVEVWCSGMYIGSISYTVPVDGNCTESITLQGNNKEWIIDKTKMHISTDSEKFGKQENYSNTTVPDAPRALTQASGGIQRRENVRMQKCIFPQGIYGIAQNTTAGNNVSDDGSPSVHMQNVSISTDFSREDILELGAKTPYFRAPGFPIEVTCDIEAIAISGDFIGAYEAGDPRFFGAGATPGGAVDFSASGDNTSEETIKIVLMDGTCFDLGASNRLSSVSYGGGDATGGNVSISYSYTNFNELDVLHFHDPARDLKYTTNQKTDTDPWLSAYPT